MGKVSFWETFFRCPTLQTPKVFQLCPAASVSTVWSTGHIPGSRRSGLQTQAQGSKPSTSIYWKSKYIYIYICVCVWYISIVYIYIHTWCRWSLQPPLFAFGMRRVQCWTLQVFNGTLTPTLVLGGFPTASRWRSSPPRPSYRSVACGN